ncbi:DUF3566 domain-containing protein [Isoptericola sp. b441]|uniref:DUF3566 domain-containing protein n=1 Tax=Actinotalea lenta TaxID=3064654 RepID=A0ABT9D5U8_9CELL|nr:MULTISPECIES: DUF3566 domain-containing protein [unclassified Isoptericola]MDO8106171.1 DUF3566 domain-containing protein [Isoptericola sp. b441]MDO8122110.1 DUF3566 domain-containing protein [Isoptericola sp. b490]
MSSEKPPSIAPKRPAGAPQRTSATIGRVSLGGDPVPVDAPVEEATGTPSLGDRMRAAASSARSAVARNGEASDRPEPARESAPDAAPRRARLSVSRIDPWSVMKLSFLLSVAVGIMIVIAAAVVWQTLNKMAVFTTANDMIGQLVSNPSYDSVLQIASFSRVISLATLIAVVDVVLLTALSTIMAFLYNIVAALVGGLHLTLTDD